MSTTPSSSDRFITRSISMTWEQKWAYRKLQKIHKQAVKDGLPDDEPIEDIGAIAKQVLSPQDRFRFYAAIATTGDAWDSDDAASAFSRYISFEKAPVLTAPHRWARRFLYLAVTAPMGRYARFQYLEDVFVLLSAGRWRKIYRSSS